MCEIIEIPVFKSTEEENILLFKGQNFINDRTYDGFRFLEYALNEIQSIYFYLIEPFNEQNNNNIWDRVIPKAPFCIYLYDFDDILIKKFYQDYSHYETPLFLAVKKEDELNEEILSQFEDKIIYFNKNDDNYFKLFFKEILNELTISS